jgi:thiol-disulfide isomerase/thioredoxin
MRKTLVLLSLGLVYTLTLKAQATENFLTSKLTPGYPKEIELIKKQVQWSEITYSLLETGNDTIKVFFGELTFQERKTYWISLIINNTISNFTMGFLMKKENYKFPSDTIDIKYDNNLKKVSVHVMHDNIKNEIEYNWLNKKQKSNIAIVENIEKPLEKGKKLPFIKVQLLNGDSILIKDFLGKYIVMNWWHTRCAPCRQEIPGLNKLVEKYKDNQNVVFISIAFDSKERVENYLKNNEFRYIQTIGDRETSKLFGETFPVHLIVNPQGVTTFISMDGSEDKYKDIDAELKRQMNEK